MHRAQRHGQKSLLTSTAPSRSQDPEHSKLSAHVKSIEDELVRIVTPHSTPKNVAKLRTLTGYLADPAVIARIMVEKPFEAEMKVVTGTLRTLVLADMSEDM